jgi:SAM-dependent methyltransferase
MKPSETIAPPSSEVYYKAGYWNDIPSVASEINRRITGSPVRSYLDRFIDRIGTRRFARGLFLNCGSGWVEREFFSRGIIDTAVGIDYTEDLLSQAREAAGDLPIRYLRMDVNDAQFPDDRYDLIVNYAACHHIAYVDRVFRSLCSRLTPDGWFVNYDYVGAHRNQYPYDQWAAVWELNNRLPAAARQILKYAHLPTMLATDPSEAVHSELILETFRRYFTIAEYQPTGGALAYPLLTFNKGLTAVDPECREAVVATILQSDHRFLIERPDLTQFAYWCGQPRHDVLEDRAMLERWERDEGAREEAARANGGLYYTHTLLQALIYPDIE